MVEEVDAVLVNSAVSDVECGSIPNESFYQNQAVDPVIADVFDENPSLPKKKQRKRTSETVEGSPFGGDSKTRKTTAIRRPRADINTLTGVRDKLILEGVALYSNDRGPNWIEVGKHAGLTREQVHHRWHGFLDPRHSQRKKGAWSQEEVLAANRCVVFCGVIVELLLELEASTPRRSDGSHAGMMDWTTISKALNRTEKDCLNKCANMRHTKAAASLKRGHFTAEEDAIILRMRDVDNVTFTIIGKALNRPGSIVSSRYRNMTKKRGPWDADEVARLLDAVEKAPSPGGLNWSILGKMLNRIDADCEAKWNECTGNTDHSQFVPYRKKKKFSFTQEEEMTLIGMKDVEKESFSAIAKALGRTTAAVSARYKSLCYKPSYADQQLEAQAILGGHRMQHSHAHAMSMHPQQIHQQNVQQNVQLMQQQDVQHEHDVLNAVQGQQVQVNGMGDLSGSLMSSQLMTVEQQAQADMLTAAVADELMSGLVQDLSSEMERDCDHELQVADLSSVLSLGGVTDAHVPS